MTSIIFSVKTIFFQIYNYYMRLVGNCMLISIYFGTMCWKGTGDELQAWKLFLMTSIIFYVKINFFKYIIIISRAICNCMLISISLGTMYCKWTGDELQASAFSR